MLSSRCVSDDINLRSQPNVVTGRVFNLFLKGDQGTVGLQLGYASDFFYNLSGDAFLLIAYGFVLTTGFFCVDK